MFLFKALKDNFYIPSANNFNVYKTESGTIGEFSPETQQKIALEQQKHSRDLHYK